MKLTSKYNTKYFSLLYCLITFVEISSELKVPQTCEIGFEYISETKQCEDINECESSETNLCNNVQKCVNVIGSYVCENLKLRRLNRVSHVSLAELFCPHGSRFNKTLNYCVDMNECEEKPCSENEECLNTQGSYKCIERIECNVGYEFSTIDGICKDIDECQLFRHNCSTERNEKCINKLGSFYCACVNGFERSKETGDCEDIDECIYANTCFYPKSHCVNTLGSYKCNCAHGFAQRGAVCVSVDQCLSNPCPQGSACLNFGDSYVCQCPKGFEFDATYTTCVDLNECETDGVYCDICINTIGSYDCKCNPGFQWSPSVGHCILIKECEDLYHNCNDDKHEKCVREADTFSCLCIEGFERSNSTGVCEDVNECTSFSSKCVYPNDCENTIGSYKCKCAPGFIERDGSCEKVEQSENGPLCSYGYIFNKDTNGCEDIDECAAGTHECLSNENCVNKVEGYNCITVTTETSTKDGDSNTTITCENGYEFNKNLNNCEFINECHGEHNCPDGEMCTNSYPGHRCTKFYCSHPYKEHFSKKHACIKKTSDRDQSRPLLIQYTAIGLRNNETITSDGLTLLNINVTDFDCEFSYSISSFWFDSSVDLKNSASLKVHNTHQATLVLKKSLSGPQWIKAFVDCNAWELIVQRSFIYIYISENK